jgi:hypothetical protein
MSLTQSFTQKFSKKGIIVIDFENFINSKNIEQTFDVDYKISQRFGKMFSRQELVNIFTDIFCQLQFTKIIVLPGQNNIELKEFQYYFYKIESSDDFSTKEIICTDNDNWIGIKAKFSK